MRLRIGKTQGMTLRISPPSTAPPSASSVSASVPCRPASRRADRRAGRRDRARRRGEGQAACRRRARARRRCLPAPTGRRGLDHQRVAVAREGLRRGIGERAIGRGEQMRVAERRRRRAAAPRAGTCPPPSRSAPAIRADAAGPCASHRTARAASDRRAPSPTVSDVETVARLGHADARRADQIVELGRDRQRRPLGQPRRHVDRHEQRIGLLVDMVHQPRDHQRRRHRIGGIARLHALGQRPVDLHREAAVARRLPIAVPARLRRHRDRDRGARAGGGRQALGRRARSRYAGRCRRGSPAPARARRARAAPRSSSGNIASQPSPPRHHPAFDRATAYVTAAI